MFQISMIAGDFAIKIEDQRSNAKRTTIIYANLLAMELKVGHPKDSLQASI